MNPFASDFTLKSPRLSPRVSRSLSLIVSMVVMFALSLVVGAVAIGILSFAGGAFSAVVRDLRAEGLSHYLPAAYAWHALLSLAGAFTAFNLAFGVHEQRNAPSALGRALNESALLVITAVLAGIGLTEVFVGIGFVSYVSVAAEMGLRCVFAAGCYAIVHHEFTRITR